MKSCLTVLFLLISILMSSCALAPALSGDVNAPGQMLVPVNHTGRYALNIFVEDAWAGNLDAHGGGGSATCCIAGRKDWSKPALVRWRWGREEDPVTREVTVPGEDHSTLVAFPRAPHRVNKTVQEEWSREDYLADEVYLCVIFRTLELVEFEFSSTRGGCATK